MWLVMALSAKDIERDKYVNKTANTTKVFTKFSTVSLCDYIWNIFVYLPPDISFNEKAFHSSDALLLCFCFCFQQYNYFVVIFPMIFSPTICWSLSLLLCSFFSCVAFGFCYFWGWFFRIVLVASAIAAQGNSETEKKHTQYTVLGERKH